MACTKAKDIENMISKNLIKKIKMAGTSWDLEGFMDKKQKGKVRHQIVKPAGFYKQK